MEGKLEELQVQRKNDQDIIDRLNNIEKQQVTEINQLREEVKQSQEKLKLTELTFANMKEQDRK